jgi:hypothetical protein
MKKIHMAAVRATENFERSRPGWLQPKVADHGVIFIGQGLIMTKSADSTPSLDLFTYLARVCKWQAGQYLSLVAILLRILDSLFLPRRCIDLRLL